MASRFTAVALRPKPAFSAAARRELERFAEPAARAGLQKLAFDGGLELRAAGSDKGLAVKAMFAELGSEAAVAYLGDDRTDEDAFAALGESGSRCWWGRCPTKRAREPGSGRRPSSWPSSPTGRRPRGGRVMNLVVVSNRLPFRDHARESGSGTSRPAAADWSPRCGRSCGNRGGAGSAGRASPRRSSERARAAPRLAQRFGYELVPVSLTAQERDGFYHGFSNEVIWPLFHDLLSHGELRPGLLVGLPGRQPQFADASPSGRRAGRFHLGARLPPHARGRGAARRGAPRIGFFLHIPFPPLDVFLKLPWRSRCCARCSTTTSSASRPCATAGTSSSASDCCFPR